LPLYLLLTKLFRVVRSRGAADHAKGGLKDLSRGGRVMRSHFARSGARRSAHPRRPGGQVGPFLDLFEYVRATGERVVIDGPCLSACTLVLSVVPDNRICVTRRAVLGFHAARSMDRRGRLYAEPEASEMVLEAYPAAVRGWIERRGGLSSHLLLLRGRDLAAIYPSCR